MKLLADYLPARVWLMKTEPHVFSFSDLLKRPKQSEKWDGVRNYQARNFMRDHMQIGDSVLFYHSSVEPPGIAGLAKIIQKAEPDLTALDPKSEYFDEKATAENPRWVAVTVGQPEPLLRMITLAELRLVPELSEMLLLRRGQRLSIMPVSEQEFANILKIAQSHSLSRKK